MNPRYTTRFWLDAVAQYYVTQHPERVLALAEVLLALAFTGLEAKRHWH